MSADLSVVLVLLGILFAGCESGIAPTPVCSLVVNEFMAKNSSESGIVDCDGNNQDWIEVYNAGDDTLHLCNYFLTDSVDNRAKFNLPDAVLAPGQCYLIWCGNSDRDPENHAGFSLSAETDVIAIYNRTLDMVDSVSCGRIQGSGKKNVSCGRILDGGRAWAIQKEPSPGFLNRG